MKLIICNQCGKRRLPSRRDSIFCALCYAEIERGMEEIEANATPSDDLFERVAFNRRDGR